MGITHAFAADITKAERDANGDLIVYGKATGPDLDLDEQVCDPGWLKQAMPEWMTWGNLREMHQPIAAGVGLELSADADNWMVKSKVVDEGTAKKIEAGALKGYSVGIKNAKVVKDASAPGGRIVGGSIVEVSYVDRPCNPTAMLAIAKAVGADTALAPVEKADASDADPADDVVVPDDVVDETGMTGEPKTITVDDVVKAVQEALAPRTFGDRDKAIALIKAVGPDGQIDETADIAGGKEAIALIAKLIGFEAEELAAGELEEACDISLLVSAVECLKCWLAKEQGADDGIAYVALAAKYGYTPDEIDALPKGMKTALTELAKRDFSAKEREQSADSGAAMSDGSFPIKNREDLKNAIHLAGNAKNPDAARAHIKRRAKALGAEDMIPDSWKTAQPDTTKTTETAGKTVSKDEIADLVKAAVTEATKAHKEEQAALRAELAKVKARPIPGGPVITAANIQRKQDDQTEQSNKAAYYEHMATQVQDPAAASGYRAKAAEIRRSLAGQSH